MPGKALVTEDLDCRLVNNQAACKRLIDSLITINPIKSSSRILFFLAIQAEEG
jgi:hypothetical protein